MKSSENLKPTVKTKRLQRIYWSLESLVAAPFSISFIRRAFQTRIRQNSINKPRVITDTKTPKAFALRMTLFSSTLDDWYSFAQWGAIICGGVALALGSRVNAKQSLEVERLKKETAVANERTAQVYRMLGPRYVSTAEKQAFVAATARLDKSIPLSLVREDAFDENAMRYARDLWEVLSLAGFKAEIIDTTKWPARPVLPFGDRMKAFEGVVMQSDSQDSALRTKLRGIVEAFVSVNVPMHGPVTAMHPELTPKGGAMIVVGSKPEPDFSPPPTR